MENFVQSEPKPNCSAETLKGKKAHNVAIRARFVLVVSDLKTVLREGGRGAGLVSKLIRPVIHGVSVRVFGIGLGLHSSKTDDNHMNANGENYFHAKDF